ncbi:uncharacterized protein BDV17DRAFT_294565 [Aspergillus undulatus]|uniref:uncharacterized protein n=1 Tax=Aspergillus undulatus TaxID=1810928 RepID=UPI003CCE18C6
MPAYHEVYLVRYELSIQDPDLPSPRYHTAILVETGSLGTGTGTLHQVTGDITSEGGMYYFPQDKSEQDKVQQPRSMEYIGVTPASSYPAEWDRVLRSIPPPRQQKAFNVMTMRTQPFKTRNPLVFYEEGEVRRPLVKCTEWTLERAVPALRASGLLLWSPDKL